MIASDTDNLVLKCCVFNEQSIVNKLCELRLLLRTGLYDCMFITETWLTDAYERRVLRRELKQRPKMILYTRIQSILFCVRIVKIVKIKMYAY